MKKIKTGSKSKKPITKRWWFWLIIAFVVIGSIGNSGDSDSKTSSKPTRASSSAPAETSTPEPEKASDYTLMFGELLDANPSGGSDGKTLVIKAKISSQASRDLTVKQNYHNVEDIIKNQGGDKFDCIDYWAVARMSDGSEQKVVAFTVDSDTIKDVANGSTVAIELGDHVDDLFVHSSLQEPAEKEASDNPSQSNADVPAPNPAPTPEPITALTPEPASASTGKGNANNFDTYNNESQQQTDATYVLNNSTMKFHYPNCDSVPKISPQNYGTSSKSRDELIQAGYSPCGKCEP